MVNNSAARKILILAANPQGTSRLRLDEEVREIQEGLRRSQHRQQFELVQRWAVRPRDIQRAMLEEQPQIVHFSGHGLGDEGLVFEDELGQPKLVSGAALASLFQLFAEQVECVVLNRCYSQVQAEAIALHIPYVIGMKQGMGDRAAIAFAVGFYDALGAGRTVEFAYQLGCSAIQLEGIAEELTPVLIQQQVKSDATPASSQPQTQPGATSMPPASQPLTVFISYSHRDEELRQELEVHLANLKRQGKISAWSDRAIEAGTEWAAEIEAKLEAAQIILLLVSPPFMASTYCYDKEMQRAMARHEAGTARVIPIILRPVDWEGTPFRKLQALPIDGKAITTWPNRDEAFLNVVQGIRRAVEVLAKKP